MSRSRRRSSSTNASLAERHPRVTNHRADRNCGSSALIHESIVAEALQKIAALNASAERTFGVALSAVTPAGLRRGEEDLFLGLSIDPDDPKDFDLPPDEDLFGRLVPLLDSDGGEAAALPEVTETEEPEADEDHAPLTWRFDDE